MQPTSVIARDKHEASGQAATNRQRVLWLVQQNEGSTSRELYQQSVFWFAETMDLTEVRRRLTDLGKAKLIHTGPQRYCRIRGNLQLTWFYGRDPNEANYGQEACNNCDFEGRVIEPNDDSVERDQLGHAKCPTCGNVCDVFDYREATE